MVSGVCLVTGGTGAVGPRLVQQLVRDGYVARVFSRKPPPSGLLPEGVSICLGDLLDEEALRKAAAGVDYIFHLAALLHVTDPPVEMRSEYHRVNVQGTAAVVRVAREMGVRRVVFFSTIAVYGVSGGRILNEKTPPQPETFYGQTKLEAEKIIVEARRMDGLKLGCALRLAAVYGPRIKGNYRRLVQALARRRFVQIGSGGNRRTLIYEQDAVNAACLLALHPVAAGRVFNVSDGQFHTVREIITTVCEGLGRKAPRVVMPIAPVRCAASLMEVAFGVVGANSPLRCATIDKYVEDVAVESRQIEDELGFRPRFNLRQGWRETILAMQQNREL